MAYDKDKVDTALRNRLEACLEAIASSGFASDIAKRIRIADISVDGVDLDEAGETRPLRSAQSTVACEIRVEDDMVNMAGNLHGGCGAWLVDVCSSLALLALSGNARWTTSGVSTNLNLSYLVAAPSGTKLRLVTKVLQFGRVTSLLETRIENAETGKLLTVGWHTKQDQYRPEAKL
ncbi:hypothetical protein JCM10212_005677 [Sporobolomyces blumeae]